MSQRQRAFDALEGRTFPRVGERGRYVHPNNGDPVGDACEYDVEVLAVTPSGITLTLRFVDRWSQLRWGDGRWRAMRRGELADGTGWYVPTARVLTGEVLFSDARGII